VADDGRIVDIHTSRHLDGEAGVEFYSGILIPGMVNAHCHLELSHLRGLIPSGGGFAAFVEGMKAAPRGCGVEAAEMWDARMWSDGVQAVGDVCNGVATFELKRRSPIRYHSFVEIFGAAANPAKAASLRDEAVGSGLRATVTPHSLYSLSRENFIAAVNGGAEDQAAGLTENSPLSIHFMESGFEVSDPAARLVAQTPKDRPVLLVHNCTVTQRDIDIVMDHFAAPVTWVVCPASNRHISGLTPPIELLRKNGLRIAIGTDSLASNDTLSMVKELLLLAPHTAATLEEMLGWATIGGARALGMDDAIGSIEVGKSPGLTLLAGVDMQTLRLTEKARTQRII
jgi:cytosine/adenosine deaminase-related metal-dependent hydrolase